MAPLESKEAGSGKSLTDCQSDIEMCTLGGNQDKRVEKKRMEDFVELGWYIVLICLAAEISVLCNGSNIFFMIYAGN